MEVSGLDGVSRFALKSPVTIMFPYLKVSAASFSNRSYGESAVGRLYVTAIKSLMLPFLSSAIKYSGLLAYCGSDLIKILTVQDFVTYRATPPPSLPALSFLKRL